ncbi:unnamed protein product [Lactuca saligna]|uniref:PATROL1-like C-terminal domain-containing protein n=1 Tax=Lactuca saligna TaxID=75948 RepID=A0AA35Z6J0_LACSI|nr:unnamed protein product [Lactuca saligna]
MKGASVQEKDSIWERWIRKQKQGESNKRSTNDNLRKESFDGSRKDINAAIDRICEFTGENIFQNLSYHGQIILWDLREPFIENVYRPSVSESRLETTLIEPLDVEPNQLCDIIVEPLRDRIVCGFIHNSKHQYIAVIDSFMKYVDEPIHAFSINDSSSTVQVAPSVLENMFLNQIFQMISNKLLVVPSPIGGVLVVCANTIHYHSQSASCILALNNYVVPVSIFGSTSARAISSTGTMHAPWSKSANTVFSATLANVSTNLVLLEPIEMTCDPTYLVNFVELYTVLASFQSHEGRVLNSLNGIKDMKSRLTSKAEYMLSDINVPSQFMRNLIDDNSSSELLEGTQIQDLYDLLEIKLVDFQINLFVPFYPTYYFPILENLNASSALALCIVQDESLLKAMEVILTNATTMSFEVRFDIPFGVSPKILDPVYLGHKFPLPLHLAESGRIRWRPLGNTYWNIISYRV